MASQDEDHAPEGLATSRDPEPPRRTQAGGRSAEPIGTHLDEHGDRDTRVDTPGTEETRPLDSLAMREVATLRVDDEPIESEGDYIGAYRLIDRLGEGSFGTVFLAEQEQPVRRRVALKLMKGRMDTRQLLVRFDLERQALALMDHPGIAKVFDAGSTHTGRPYFVMELVEGVPITKYCDAGRLTIRRRVELMADVCRSIQHAHQKGLIHRDLKPSNVLVAEGDEGPVPKVIDFGIAKAIGEKRPDDTQLTECYQILGTPLYMSPEQTAASGTDVDARSDVYSLGSLLYELLAGDTPIPRDTPRRIRFDELCRLIQEQEPPRPSARVAAQKPEGAEPIAANRGTVTDALAKQLRGDLDWIVMKCVDKDPGRRYESASGLAMDLRRHLACKPVLAGPPTAAYRLRKFAKRNRGAVLATSTTLSILAICLAAGLILLGALGERSREVRRLSDARILRELDAEVAGLPKLDAGRRHDAMASWVRRAHDVLSRRDVHRVALDRMVRRGAGSGDGAEPSAVETLGHLVADLDALDSPGGKLAQVEAWLVATPSHAETQARWAKATSAIAAAHPGIHLSPRGGLLPLDRDRESGLWEFVDLASGQPPGRDGQGRMVVDDETGVVFVLLPGGRTTLGSPADEAGRKPDDMAERSVELRPMLIAKYEITQAQWGRVMGQNPAPGIDPAWPKGYVSWFEAGEFCLKAKYQLPSEAQWEYACRGGSRGPYALDLPLEDQGWFRENSGDAIHRVGQKRPNRFGLHDMHGNVLEWCRDVYTPDYQARPDADGKDPVDDPPDETQNKDAMRILRGGPFDGTSSFCRCADRWREPADVHYRNHGFRPIFPIR